MYIFFIILMSTNDETKLLTDAQINIQKLDTKQSVVNSLGMFLAIAEGYLIAKGAQIQPLFAYYDYFNVTSEDHSLIRIKLMNNYMAFLAQKKNYLKIFKQYDFYPDNFSVGKIKAKIKEWIPYAYKIGEQDLYNEIFALFDEDINKAQKYYFKEIQDYRDINPQKPKVVDPRNDVKAIAYIQHFKHEEHLQNEKKWKKEQNPSINIILNGKAGSSSLTQKLKPITSKSQKKIEEEVNDVNCLYSITKSLISNATYLFTLYGMNEKEKKRREIKSEIKNAKLAISNFEGKYGSIDPLWDKIKFENEIKYPLEKLSNGSDNVEDKKIFKNIISLYDPDL